MKGDYSFSDLKNKNVNIFLKKNSSQVGEKQLSIPCETKNSLFDRISSITNTKLMNFVAGMVILNNIFKGKC